MITIIELPTFLARVGESISAEERDEFIDYIGKNPEIGTVIPGTNGVRKIRWASKNKGKRGGARIIYFFYNEHVPLFLITAYAKNEKADLTPQQKKQISSLAEVLKVEAKQIGGAKR